MGVFFFLLVDLLTSPVLSVRIALEISDRRHDYEKIFYREFVIGGNK